MRKTCFMDVSQHGHLYKHDWPMLCHKRNKTLYRKNNQLCKISNRSRVIGWISGGIGKVVPQPETKYTETREKPDEEVTEVFLPLMFI